MLASVWEMEGVRQWDTCCFLPLSLSLECPWPDGIVYFQFPISCLFVQKEWLYLNVLDVLEELKPSSASPNILYGQLPIIR